MIFTFEVGDPFFDIINRKTNTFYIIYVLP